MGSGSNANIWLKENFVQSKWSQGESWYKGEDILCQSLAGKECQKCLLEADQSYGSAFYLGVAGGGGGSNLSQSDIGRCHGTGGQSQTYFQPQVTLTACWSCEKFDPTEWGGKIGKMPRRGLVAPQNTFLETVLNRWCATRYIAMA